MHRRRGWHNENVGTSPRGESKTMWIKRDTLLAGARALCGATVCATSVAERASAAQFGRLASVPEPGSLTIFALALLGIWVVKRHTDGRNKK
jgi:hypothetical protein